MLPPINQLFRIYKECLKVTKKSISDPIKYMQKNIKPHRNKVPNFQETQKILQLANNQ